MASAIAADGAQGRPVLGDEAVYREVYDAILAHHLAPGTKLAEDALGDVFGVSRTVVRKALIRLAHDGLVEIRPHRGAIVARPTVEEARDVFAARQVVERAIIEALVGQLDAAQLEDLRAMARDEHAAFHSGDRTRWIRLSGDFHLRLADLAGNRVLADFLHELVSRTSLIISLYEQPGTSACAADEHVALVDALAEGDTRKAIDLMSGHLSACEDKLNLDDQGETADLAAVFGRRRHSEGPRRD